MRRTSRLPSLATALSTTILAAFLLASAAWPCSARAQAEDVPPEDRDRAVELFRQSAERYEEGRFDEAAALLREAHDLYPEPVLLYNLGRALDGLGDTDGALEAYEQYLEEAPDAPDRAEVEARIDAIRELDAEEAAAQSETDAVTGSTEPPPTAPPLEDSGTGGEITPWPWILAGTGVAVVAVGSVLGLMAQSRRDQAVQEPIHAQANVLFEQSEDLATAANVAFLVGGVGIATGVAWGLVDLLSGDPAETESPTAPQVRIGPGVVEVHGRF